MALQDEIDARRQEIQTEGYPMSIGELLNLYRDSDLDIHPEFQRIFRWSTTQKSRFIESILLGIPIPSLFVNQRADGVWDVIDGLQRLSTIFEFMGELRNEEGNVLSASTLEGTKYLPSLAGKKWEVEDEATSLDDVQRRLIKRAALDLKIIRRESDPETPLELFQRLNTGGSQLSDQELRNSLLIMIRRDFYPWLQELQEIDAFQTAVAPSDRAKAEQYDLELVVRFLALEPMPSDHLRGVGDLTEFLTDAAVDMAKDDNLDRQGARAKFEGTFRVLAEALEDEVFRRYDSARARFVGGFSVSAFEAITTGVAHHLEDWLALPEGERTQAVSQRVKDLWDDSTFRSYATGGVRASTRIPQVIPLGRDLFSV